MLGQDELDVERSFANLPQVQTTTFGELSAHDVIRADWLVFSDRTLPSSPSQFSGTHVVAEEPARRPRPTPSRSHARRGRPRAGQGHEGGQDGQRRRRRGRRRSRRSPKWKRTPEAASAESGEEADTDA